ncbi:MAG TPA: hypothetical protein DGZ34_06585 [Lachnospiraceae bacterium]|nr:hypothetical protein [Lachnospiraceae bacterium]
MNHTFSIFQYGVTTDYLLGRGGSQDTETTLPLPYDQLRVSNGKPVWSDKYGWLLISSSAQEFIAATGEHIPFDAAGEIRDIAPRFAEGAIPQSDALTQSEVCSQTQVWVEPISPDPEMREYLRGWYQVKDRFVENEYGTKFSLDSYGAKWLAFNMK